MSSPSPAGYWVLVLHSHLPFVRHPEYKDALEERWLYEAITETYIPLLNLFERLTKEKISFKLVLSLTPPLCTMLSDKLLQERYLNYLNSLIELSEKEKIRTQYNPNLNPLSIMYLNKLKEIYKIYLEEYNKNILGGFKHFQEEKNIEIITSSATHAFLPLISLYPNAVRAQILTGINEYKKNFGAAPVGIWNSECGYYPGLEKILKEENIKYFFVDTHGILYANQYPKYGVYAPMATENNIAYFGRDVETSESVWSAREGYPGDPYYREFYRDIGFDLDYEYIKPYIHESGLRISTGIKYHRITSKNLPLEYKQYYNPEKALKKAKEHAIHFVLRREQQIENLGLYMDRPPLIVSMYDSELFGHWWYEGPEFLYYVFKLIDQSNTASTILPREYLNKYPKNQIANPPLSSWGFNGYNEFWLNDTNDWIYRHIHKSCEIMIELANKNKNSTNPSLVRALNQAARELLLSQSSDWAFIMKTNTMSDYAVKRTKTHIANFNKIYEMIKNKKINIPWLSEIELIDNIFPDIDFRIYCDKIEA